MLLFKKPGREKRMLLRGQTPLEIMGIAVVLAALLLLVLVTTYNRNMETKQLLEISENSIQCSEMSATIARLYSNRASTKETVHIATAAELQRVTGKPGGIQVGEISCRYIGNVEYDNSDNSPPPTINDIDPGGISLSVGSWCFEKQPDTNVVVSGGECS